MRYGPRRSIYSLLRGATLHWRALRLVRWTLILGILSTALVLLGGLGLQGGWLTARQVALLFPALMVGTSLAWLCLAVYCALAEEDAASIAASLERVYPALMDRLNTLVFLRGHLGRSMHPYVEQIADQAGTIAARLPRRSPFSVLPALKPLLILGPLLLATIWFYAHWRPWDSSPSRDARLSPGAAVDPTPEIPLPEDPSPPPAREDAAWSEIRITQPGGDVRATPLDVIPLRIEAAANQPIRQIAWLTSLNGGPETEHRLPEPGQPRFAAYEPELDLQALGANEWDVVAYYARAVCADGKSCQSGMYYVEVFPFREDLKRLPGGRQGPNYEVLRELTGMVQRQEEVVRQTRGTGRSIDESDGERKRQREALARGESELAGQSQHLLADLESQGEPQTLRTLKPLLGKAQTALRAAEHSLQAAEIASAIEKETAALKALTDARKQFPESLAANPAPSSPQSDSRAEQGPSATTVPQTQQDLPPRADPSTRQNPPVTSEPPVRQNRSAEGAPPAQRKPLPKPDQAGPTDPPKKPEEDRRRYDQLAEKLAEMGARRLEFQDGRQVVEKTLAEQRQVEQQATGDRPTLSQLARRERQLRQVLVEFRKENPRSLADCTRECDAVLATMEEAARLLQYGDTHAPEMVSGASQRLQELDNALQQSEQANRIAEGYQLKRLLDEQVRQLRLAEQGKSPVEPLDRLARGAKSVTGQLKQIAEEKPAGTHFGAPLGKALRDEKKRQIDCACDRVALAQGDPAKRMAACSLRQGLEEVAAAFDASRPGSHGRQPEASLTPEGEEAIEDGLRRLESLTRRQAGGRLSSQRGQPRLGQEAFESLEAGFSSVFGRSERSQEVLRRLQEDLQQRDTAVDAAVIQGLRKEIQQLRREAAQGKPASGNNDPKTYVDATQLPASYRKSIERYFQRLSEQQ